MWFVSCSTGVIICCMVDPSLNIYGCVIVCELSICLYVDKNGRDLEKGSKCDGR